MRPIMRYVRTQLPGTVPLAAVLACALVLAACGDQRPGTEWQGSVVDSAGTQVVHNPAEGLWTEETRWTYREELRIGALDGSPELQFGQISGVDVSPEGEILVLDAQAQEVRVFGPDGAYLRTLGEAGSGPGELGPGAAGVFLAPDGSVRVVDPLNQRVNAYEPDGTPRGSFPLDFRGGIPLRWEMDPSGRLVAQLRGMGVPGMEAHEGGDPIVVYGEDGTVTDTIHRLPRGQSVEFSQGQVPRIRMFEPEPLWDLGSEGTLVSAMNDRYLVDVRDAAGELRHMFSLPFERRPVEESDRTLFRRLLREVMENQGTPPQAVEAVLSNVSFGESYPAFGSLLSGPGGTTWVQNILTAADISEGEVEEINPQDLGSPRWDVFDPEGRFLGTLELPRRFTPLRVVDDAIYGVWRDDLDVQHVMLLQIERPPATS